MASQSRGFLYKQEAHGKRHCGAGTMGREQAEPPVSGGRSGLRVVGQEQLEPDSPMPGPGEELPFSWLSQEEVPH